MTKLLLKIPCHDQSISIFVEKHAGRFLSYVETQCQNTTSMTKGQTRDWIPGLVRATLIVVERYTMDLVVISPVPHHLPRLVQPDRTWVYSKNFPPRPTVYEGIPFIWGFGDVWGMLQGYVGAPLDISAHSAPTKWHSISLQIDSHSSKHLPLAVQTCDGHQTQRQNDKGMETVSIVHSNKHVL